MFFLDIVFPKYINMPRNGWIVKISSNLEVGMSLSLTLVKERCHGYYHNIQAVWSWW